MLPQAMIVSSCSAAFHVSHAGHCLHAAIYLPSTFFVHESFKARGHKSAWTCDVTSTPTAQYSKDRNVLCLVD